MLHELLLALHGHQGQIFFLGKAAGSTPEADTVKVNTSLPLFHPAELSLLRELLSVASEFAALQEFVRSHRDASTVQPDDEGGFWLRGLYVEALCEGLAEILLPYKRTLAELEQKILDCGSVQMTHVQHKIQPFQPVLYALNNLVKQLHLRKVHGCFILDVLYKASCSGVERVQNAMKKLLHEGHKVFYKQLLAWILQGRLFDPYSEFFIAEVDQDDVTSTMPSQLYSSTSTSRLSDTTGTAVQGAKQRSYRLKPDFVPGHISLKLAEKIFFIGESIHLFVNDRRLHVQGQVLRERETEFYQQLSSLRDHPEFVSTDFERFVDGIGLTASRHLYDLIMGTKGSQVEKTTGSNNKGPDLLSELSCARDFFFLGRGELFHTFIREANVYLAKPVSATTQHDVNQAFLSACRQVLPDSEGAIVTSGGAGGIGTKIRVLIDPNTAAAVTAPNAKRLEEELSTRKIVTGWDCLLLQYSVPWPLHLVITEKALQEYNRVFRFLLTVKRAQVSLNHAWAEHKVTVRSRRKEIGADADKWTYARLLRLRMSFVVDNLQQYFLADVLATQFLTLTQKLTQNDAVKDFEGLRTAHTDFVMAVAAQTFVNYQPVNKCLNELLLACLRFCHLWESSSSSNSSSSVNSAESENEFRHLGLAFGRQSELLFQLLTSIKSRQQGCHLAQLLLRIDYNRYFSNHGHDVGTIAQSLS